MEGFPMKKLTLIALLAPVVAFAATPAPEVSAAPAAATPVAPVAESAAKSEAAAPAEGRFARAKTAVKDQYTDVKNIVVEAKNHKVSAFIIVATIVAATKGVEALYNYFTAEKVAEVKPVSAAVQKQIADDAKLAQALSKKN
jgi:hypothetical protein